jgi:hypothetical protein
MKVTSNAAIKREESFLIIQFTSPSLKSYFLSS